MFSDFASPFSIILVLLGSFLFLKYGKSLRNDFIVKLFVAAIVIQVISWYLNSIENPQWTDNSPKPHRMGVWFKMIPIAFILGANNRTIYACWLIAILAILSAPWVIGGGLAEWQLGLSAERVDFGINNAQHTAALNATALLSLYVLLLGYMTKTKDKFELAPFLFACVASFVCFLAIFVTQTRSVWLGAACGIGALFVCSYLTGQLKFNNRTVTLLIITLVFLCGFVFLLKDTLTKRYVETTEEAVIVEDNAINGEVKNWNSIQIRISSWKEALSWIEQKPFFGWGGKIEPQIMKPLNKKITFHNIKHLHSSYIETAANYGITGLLLVLSLFFYLGIAAIKSWQANVMPLPVFIFIVSFSALWAVINLFESYIFYTTGEYLFALIGGTILSYHWKTKLQAAET